MFGLTRRTRLYLLHICICVALCNHISCFTTLTPEQIQNLQDLDDVDDDDDIEDNEDVIEIKYGMIS